METTHKNHFAPSPQTLSERELLNQLYEMLLRYRAITQQTHTENTNSDTSEQENKQVVQEAKQLIVRLREEERSLKKLVANMEREPQSLSSLLTSLRSFRRYLHGAPDFHIP